MCFVPNLAYPLSLYTLKASVNLPHVRMLDNYLEMYVQGVQQNCLHLVICSFVGFYSCKMKKFGRFLQIWEICYMMGTRILKFDLEIAEIIEIKVATFNMEIIFLPL